MRLSDLLILVLVAVLMVIFSPIILPLVAYSFVRNKIDEKRFKRYLEANEGKIFFAYTDRPSSKEFIEGAILPKLPGQAHVFHLAGKKGRYNMREDLGLLAYAVAAMRQTPGGFPYISKVVQGRLLTESINNKLYSAIRRGGGSEAVVEKILKFYGD